MQACCISSGNSDWVSSTRPWTSYGFERGLLVLLILQILIGFFWHDLIIFFSPFVLSRFVVSFFVSLLSYACLLAYSVFSMHRQLQGRSTIGRGKSFWRRECRRIWAFRHCLSAVGGGCWCWVWDFVLDGFCIVLCTFNLNIMNWTTKKHICLPRDTGDF